MNATPDELRRFFSFVRRDAVTHCWRWIGGCDPDGYGIFGAAGGRSVRAHRWFYEVSVSPVGPGQHLDHYVCENTSCVNPDHLRPASPWENLLRGRSLQANNKAKTECVHGHPFTEANTHVTRLGKRQCRACARESARKQRAKRKAA